MEIKKDLLVTVRTFLFLAGLGIPPFWYVYEIVFPTAVDPMWMRLGLGATALLIFLLSFLSTYLKNRVLYLVYPWIYLNATWLLYLTLVNNAHPYYIFADLVWLTVYAALFQSMRSLMAFTLSVVAGSVAIITWLPEPLFSKLLFNLMFPLAMSIGLFQAYMKARLEKQVLAEEQSFRTIFNESVDGMFLLSVAPPRVVLDCNMQALKIFGYKDRSEMVGQGREQIFKEGLTAEDSQAISAALQKSGHWQKTMQVVTFGGASFWADMVIRGIQLGDKQVLLVRVSDITLIRGHEAELTKKNLQLAEQNKVMIGRELQMVELKKRVSELQTKLGVTS